VPTALCATTRLLLGIIIFIGLPLVAWGLRDIPGFFGNPARLGYVVLSVLLQIYMVMSDHRKGRDRGPVKKIVERQRLAVVLLQLLTLLIVVVAPYGDRRGFAVLDDSVTIRYLGLGLYCLGHLAMHQTEMFLGEHFSLQVSIREGHRLVTDGPYRYVRHPRYLSIAIFALGLSLLFRSWLALALAAATTLVLIWRIRDEEAMMGEEFGPAWLAYTQRSWRLIPFLY
jgi:protein-S-isoprenylcysteine O-methyltransferase Ste14